MANRSAPNRADILYKLVKGIPPKVVAAEYDITPDAVNMLKNRWLGKLYYFKKTLPDDDQLELDLK